jgi:hypothetical protein
MNVEDLAFAITRSEVELSDRDQCVKTFRLRVKSEIFTWIGLYRKAYEIGFSREGGYYGAGVWLAGITVNARLVLDVLKDLADQMNALAIVGSQFQRPLSDIIDDMIIPSSLMPLKESSARYLRGGLLPDAMPGAYICQSGSHREIIDWAQNDVLAEKFRSIIIAPDASFPRGASSRLERFADLNEVVRKLESDLSIKIARLENDKLALQKHVEIIESELASAQLKTQKFAQEVEQWKGRCDKLERQRLRYLDSENGRSWSWRDYIFYALILAILVLVGFMGYFLVYFLLDKITPDAAPKTSIGSPEQPHETLSNPNKDKDRYHITDDRYWSY